MWTTLRKGGAQIYIEYGLTHTSNLSGYDVRVRTVPSIELMLDLNPNLRTRNRAENGYCDARELADGEIAKLNLLQIDDGHIMKGLRRVLIHAPSVTLNWTLVVELEGPHIFHVQPEHRSTGRTLFLRVVS